MLEIFDIQFENSIRYGMSYEQFWDGCPELYYTYEKMYKEKLKEKDLFNWQLGVYLQYAIGSCLDNSVKYPDQPLFFAHEERKVNMMEKFLNMVSQVNKKFE